MKFKKGDKVRLTEHYDDKVVGRILGIITVSGKKKYLVRWNNFPTIIDGMNGVRVFKDPIGVGDTYYKLIERINAKPLFK